MQYAAGLTLLLTASFACSSGDADKKPSADKPAAKVAANTAAAAPAKKDTAPLGSAENPIPIQGEGIGFSGRHRSEEGDKWVPAEFKTGMAKFKDPGVYVDGKPVGFLKWGELPVPLDVWWYEERAAIPFKRGHKGPKYKIVKQRRYRWVDYFKALGVDVKNIKELHIYGGTKRRIAVVAKGKDLRSKKDFGFRFGTDVQGKPIPACPPNSTDSNCPDNIRSIAVYIKKKPPTRVGGYFFHGKKQIMGIPYYGEPMRGGIRVYMDGPLVAQIKRRKLKDEKLKAPSTDGKTHWKFFAFLESQGVDTSKIQEAWIINDNRRRQRISRKDLVDATFTAAAQRKGRILFGKNKYEAKAIALHSKPVPKDHLAVVLPHEEP